MKRVIYISGPITDNKTGLPREGWHHDFQAAEKMLVGLGFSVINPVRLAGRSEHDWANTSDIIRRSMDTKFLTEWPQHTPRWYYLMTCITRLSTECMTTHFSNVPEAIRMLSGIYVLGLEADVRNSYGTMCEINFAMSAGLPVWAQFSNDWAVTNFLEPDLSKPSLQEMAASWHDESLK